MMTRPSRRTILLASAALALVAIVAALAVWLFRPKSEPDVVEVPLGVEEAVIITSDQGPIEPLPFAVGVAVNVRIAAVREVGPARVYDVRYIVNRAGEFDLKDYFRFTDGRPAAASLPSFRVRGLERLTKDIEARIAETEETGVGLRSWYYETLAALTVLWIAWLLLLIFWGRHRTGAAAPPPPEPTLADRIRAVLRELEAGVLTADQRAELELMIFRQWRQSRSWTDRPMAESLAAFRADPDVAEAYAELENWLHHPRPAASPAQVAGKVRSRLEPAAALPAAQQGGAL